MSDVLYPSVVYVSFYLSVYYQFCLMNKTDRQTDKHTHTHTRIQREGGELSGEKDALTLFMRQMTDGQPFML